MVSTHACHCQRSLRHREASFGSRRWPWDHGWCKKCAPSNTRLLIILTSSSDTVSILHLPICDTYMPLIIWYMINSCVAKQKSALLVFIRPSYFAMVLQDHNGVTVLHRAASDNRDLIVTFLLKAGANQDAKSHVRVFHGMFHLLPVSLAESNDSTHCFCLAPILNFWFPVVVYEAPTSDSLMGLMGFCLLYVIGWCNPARERLSQRSCRNRGDPFTGRGQCRYRKPRELALKCYIFYAIVHMLIILFYASYYSSLCFASLLFCPPVSSARRHRPRVRRLCRPCHRSWTSPSTGRTSRGQKQRKIIDEHVSLYTTLLFLTCSHCSCSSFLKFFY